MHPAPTTSSEGGPLSFSDEIKIATGAEYYPAIAENQELQAAVMQICRNARDLSVVHSAVHNEGAAEEHVSDDTRSLAHWDDESCTTAGRQRI
jgi:hypothetical protein